MSTSIDDLLAFEEEPAPQAQATRGGRVRGGLKAVAVTGALTAVVVAGLRTVGLQVSLAVVVAGVVALLAVRRVTAALAPPPPPRGGARAPAGEEDGHYHWAARDALRAAINGWERPLDWSSGRPERFAERILPRLGELADERLRQRHGVTRESDPARARALLGERLSTFLDTPPRRTPSSRDLAAIVAELEKI
ncbi:hypothetical protein C5N14_24815 [Micromonospora sp. MW-13]|uniref:hypothetical protein n=1 Tax=unclassified Micromonospora TaxID=2617518 RepID=UPI000E44E2DC|nr:MULTISPECIES: hypothetical protein [unclassified Micromonospora]MCX4474323.1 hypothetical protein [Micromonospora sp. NBC_01655]RGC66204.1 hypothetical protein C5N14_24815 [Micromonospora sp. MW-13]